jgi:hypothetical protein
VEIKKVRPSHRLMHDSDGGRFLLDMSRHEAVRRRLLEAKIDGLSESFIARTPSFSATTTKLNAMHEDDKWLFG